MLIEIDSELEIESLKNEVYLCILYAYRIPPHAAMLIDGIYYSLSIKGKEINSNTAAFLKNIHARKIPSLFFKLNKPNAIDLIETKHLMIQELNAFEKVNSIQTSCLNPIKNFINSWYNIDCHNQTFIYQLIPFLYDTHKIELTLALYHPAKTIELPVYDKHELKQEIDKALKIIQTFSLK
jgi:hypothetical protein